MIKLRLSNLGKSVKLAAPKPIIEVEKYTYKDDGTDKEMINFEGSVATDESGDRKTGITVVQTAEGVEVSISILPPFISYSINTDDYTDEDWDFIDAEYAQGDTSIVWGWKDELSPQSIEDAWDGVEEFAIGSRIFILGFNSD